MATAEFPKFAGILSTALYQHNLLGFKIAQLEFPPPPLALFIVMLPKAQLTSHSRSGSRWVITPSWLSGSGRSFLYGSSVHSCHLFLISSASVRSIMFLSFIVPVFTRNASLVSLVLFKRSLVFPILLFSSISFHCSLRNVFLSLLDIIWNSTFRWVSVFFSFVFCFSSFLSYLGGFLRQPFYLFAFLLLGNGFDHSLLYYSKSSYWNFAYKIA